MRTSFGITGLSGFAVISLCPFGLSEQWGRKINSEQCEPLTRHRARLAVVIVSYGNPRDLGRCLRSLATSDWTDFEIFVCENGGEDAFAQLQNVLIGQEGLLLQGADHPDPIDGPGGRLAAVVKCRLQSCSTNVWLGAAVDNLGYGGGVNVWLERLLPYPGWEAVLVLNPDTEVARTCLSELMAKADEGFGMVGGSLVFDDAPDRIINYGLHWSRTTGRRIAIGRDSPVGSVPSDTVLASIDSISGACMLVTRAFVEDVGLMEEDFFLYMEDLDWGWRRGRHKIGFAQRAIVRHVCGASIGSAVELKARSPLAVYLDIRNSLIFSRRWAGRYWPLHFAASLLEVIRCALYRDPETAKIALLGLRDGVRGETGRPSERGVLQPRCTMPEGS